MGRGCRLYPLEDKKTTGLDVRTGFGINNINKMLLLSLAVSLKGNHATFGEGKVNGGRKDLFT